MYAGRTERCFMKTAYASLCKFIDSHFYPSDFVMNGISFKCTDNVSIAICFLSVALLTSKSGQLPVLLLQRGQKRVLYIGRHGNAPGDARPEIDGRQGDQCAIERHDLKVIVEV